MQYMKLSSLKSIASVSRLYRARSLSLRPSNSCWKKLTSSGSTASQQHETNVLPLEVPQVDPPQEQVAVIESIDTLPEKRLERFIPVTCRTLLQMLVKEEGLLTNNEKDLIESVGASLDAKYSQTFYSILEEAKFLYDPMDPDKDTFQTRDPSRKEVLDNEYYLLQKVEKLLDKGNFCEIPRDQLVSLLHDRDTNGVIVTVDPSEYELLRMWTKGQEVKERSLYLRMKEYLIDFILRRRKKEIPSLMTYTRVFLAVRSKKDKKLHLKVFKDIHANELEHLLPRGKIRMSTFDKRFIASSVLLGASIPFMKILPILSDLKIQWVWGGVGMAGFIAGRAWMGYKNKRNQYLANLATTLYFKTVANNRGVLNLLSDRAQDEEFKESFLAYTFLLSPIRDKTSDLTVYDTSESLKSRIEEWLQRHFQLTNFTFDVKDALNKLDDLGLLIERRNGTLTVVSVKDALSILPEPSETPWLIAGARRDSQSMDEEMKGEQKTRHALLPGWR